jgi:TetR/AcrR family transcriptional repressor of nem operon
VYQTLQNPFSMARPKQFDQAAALQKAIGVFWKKGYAATSVTELVEAMGINAPSLYATYGDKRCLFLTALRCYQQSQREWMNGLLASGLPAREVLRQLLEAMVEESLSDPDRKGCFMVNTTTELANQDEEIFRLVAENERSMRGVLAQLVQQGKETGEFSPGGDPALVATYLFTLMQGLRLITATNQDRAQLQATLEMALSRL